MVHGLFNNVHSDEIDAEMQAGGRSLFQGSIPNLATQSDTNYETP
jgi:hypothetical protein